MFLSSFLQNFITTKEILLPLEGGGVVIVIPANVAKIVNR